MTSLNQEQIRVLLAPINARRIKKLDGNSYLTQHDVRAMLTRMFGFCGWSLQQIHEPRLVSRVEKQNRNGQDRVAVTYLCSVRIIIHLASIDVCYSGVGTHTSTMSPNNEGDAHDSALKSADSAALKRAAINLGDQFGLGLYNAGSAAALVRKVWDPASGQFISDVEGAVQPHSATDAPDDSDEILNEGAEDE